MSTSTIIATVIAVVVVLSAGLYFFTRYTVNPAIVHFDEVNVADGMITLQNGSFEGSAMWYQGYTTKYENGVLSVMIKARSIKLPDVKNDPFTISLPNTYSGIREIRISGGGEFPDKTVWASAE